ncbi:MAG: phytanoyl-CoA dioxygenase family protein [Myxococcota bacterium]|nr:phytanoyl-CoA dioxygenase family protein [Myxococcota bacterium]
MIDATRREEFARRGVIRIEGLIPEALVSPARERAFECMDEDGVTRDGVWIDGRATGWECQNRILKKLKPWAKSDAFRRLITDEVIQAAHDLAPGHRLQPMVEHPQILFTPPNAEAWTVPHKVWHLDVPRLGPDEPPGVQMFTFLDRVEPGGGGTLVAAGSHRLLNGQGRIQSKDVKKRLQREPWFRELLRNGREDRKSFLEAPERVGDVELQVVEMHGEPGDVYLTDLRLLHTLAPNATMRPRLMVTQRFFRMDLLAQTYGGGEGDQLPADV